MRGEEGRDGGLGEVGGGGGRVSEGRARAVGGAERGVRGGGWESSGRGKGDGALGEGRGRWGRGGSSIAVVYDFIDLDDGDCRGVRRATGRKLREAGIGGERLSAVGVGSGTESSGKKRTLEWAFDAATQQLSEAELLNEEA
ncbi:uncharacterized protein A4U43_C07F14670 [Asparagus officinalis]|uniref:Uncharacterized protein n=1 Tax=Asparagus officinalis TaxID=4686 RepID=A0A5P1EC54_ASPOF|nr:uncharacterized protein A4U43_C07F14670 [Asparagus officinalis]